VHHDFGQDADFHYHEVEEWLEVTQGAFAFYPAGDLVKPFYPAGDREKKREPPPIVCKVGDTLRIPQGEVHSVKIVDPDGVTYTMWTPIPSGLCFQHMLSPQLKDLVRRNLELPGVENRYDLAKRSGGRLEETDDQFLQDFVSPALSMHTVKGAILDRDNYLKRDAATSTRSSSDAVHILNVTTEPESVLLSTVVTVTYTAPQQAPADIINFRLFVKEDGRFKCRVWRNYPKP
jgi:hypothetical protein